MHGDRADRGKDDADVEEGERECASTRMVGPPPIPNVDGTMLDMPAAVKEPGRAAGQPAVVAAMREPGFYPHAPAAVDVCETHISWVFLAGDRVYKVKKELVLPFLDYGTLERRGRFCREEVQLNRRLAPDVYLGVRSIVPDDGHLRLAGDDRDDAVEYAVEMKRLDERSTLARRLEQGDIQHSDIERIAERLAEFHNRAPAAGDGRGRPAQVKRTLDETFTTLLDAVPSGEREQVGVLARFAEAFVVGRHDTLSARARRDVRDCHGDLRAEHVVIADDIQVFDCIEFDPALRYIDVAADLAFLAMDLEFMGRPDLAAALVRSYRVAGGDPGDDCLLAFYAAYRACVRAKVRALSAGRPDPQDGGDRAGLEVRELLTLARRLAWRGRGHPLVVVCGVARSGKTTLARRIAEVWGVPHLSSDVIRKRLAGLEPAQAAPPETYADEASRRTYAELGRMVAARSSEGGVVVDATFRRRADREAFGDAAGRAAELAVFVECRAPASVLLDRVRRRRPGDDASDATAGIVESQVAEFEPLDEVRAGRHLPLRADRAVDEVLADLEAALDARLLGGAPDPGQTGS